MENSVLERELLELELIENFKQLLELELSDRERLNEGDLSVIDKNQERRKDTYSLLSEVLLERDSDKTKELILKINKRLNVSSLDSFKKDEKVVQMLRDDISDLIGTSLEIETPVLEPVIVVSEPKEIVIIEEEVQKSNDTEVDKLLEFIDERIKKLESEVNGEAEDGEGYTEAYTYFGHAESKEVEPTTVHDLNNLFDPKIEEEKKEKHANLENELKIRASQKLTREEVDSFIKKIDDKLAELEASASALDANRFYNTEEF